MTRAGPRRYGSDRSPTWACPPTSSSSPAERAVTTYPGSAPFAHPPQASEAMEAAERAVTTYPGSAPFAHPPQASEAMEAAERAVTTYPGSALFAHPPRVSEAMEKVLGIGGRARPFSKLAGPRLVRGGARFVRSRSPRVPHAQRPDDQPEAARVGGRGRGALRAGGHPLVRRLRRGIRVADQAARRRGHVRRARPDAPPRIVLGHHRPERGRPSRGPHLHQLRT